MLRRNPAHLISLPFKPQPLLHGRVPVAKAGGQHGHVARQHLLGSSGVISDKCAVTVSGGGGWLQPAAAVGLQGSLPFVSRDRVLPGASSDNQAKVSVS